MRTLTSLMQAAKDIIEAHNQAMEGTENLVSWPDFEKNLKAIGGTTVEALAQATWEDLTDSGLPRIIARRVAQLFRDDKAQPKRSKVVAGMTYEELFGSYDPSGETNSAVAKRLREESQEQPCVVVDQNGVVDVERSAKLLRELKQGYPPLTVILDGDRLLEVVKVGEPYNLFASENPLYPGQPLRSGDVCHISLRSWANIPFSARQICFLALTKTDELKIGHQQDAHWVLDTLGSKPEITAKTRFPKAAMLLQQLLAAGSAPLLRIKLGEQKQVSKLNDPFTAHRKY